eukprot:XP_011664236.1 PREDICTED: uncharacterized protein LOC105438297 [Strongylocentrotus purpuratus]
MEGSVHSIGLTTTVHAVSETNNPTQSTRELVTTKFSTNIYSTLSSGASTHSETCTCSPKGVQIGLIVVVVALLLYAIAITFLHIQFRRKVPTRTGENGPDPYMDLQPRPEACRTYQEMAIPSTTSSKTPGESRLPSSNLFYENQNVAQYANKIKEGADYEDVLTPN